MLLHIPGTWKNFFILSSPLINGLRDSDKIRATSISSMDMKHISIAGTSTGIFKLFHVFLNKFYLHNFFIVPSYFFIFSLYFLIFLNIFFIVPSYFFIFLHIFFLFLHIPGTWKNSELPPRLWVLEKFQASP